MAWNLLLTLQQLKASFRSSMQFLAIPVLEIDVPYTLFFYKKALYKQPGTRQAKI